MPKASYIDDTMLLLLVTCVLTFAGHVSAQPLGSLPPALEGVPAGPTAQPPPPPPPAPADDEPEADADADAPFAIAQAFADDPDDTDDREIGTVAAPTGFMKPKPEPLGPLPRQCECVAPRTDQNRNKIIVGDIRGLSDKWCDGGDSSSNSFGLSNMVWTWGQFIDHDVVGSEPPKNASEQYVKMMDNPTRFVILRRTGPEIGVDLDNCGGPESTHTGLVDGTPVYGTIPDTEELLKDPLRDGCHLRAEPGPKGEFLPLAAKVNAVTGTLEVSIVAGDFRAEEQAILTAMHTVWMREHNRLCTVMETGKKTKDLPGKERFEIAKATVISKMQVITLEEFLPALGIRPNDLKRRARDGFDISGVFATVEFSIAYRLGHTLIPDKIGRFSLGGLFKGGEFFLEDDNSPNPHPSGKKYRDDSDDDIDDMMRAVAQESAAELDGKMSNGLRNILFGPLVVKDGIPSGAEDLCTRNIYRGRDLHLPSYAGLARCYGIEPNQATERETPDAWLGLNREPKQGNDVLGPTLKAILVEHFARVLFGPDGNYWRKNELEKQVRRGDFRREVRRTTLAKVISMNTGANLSGNSFKV